MEVVAGKGWSTDVDRAIDERFATFFASGVRFSIVPVEVTRKQNQESAIRPSPGSTDVERMGHHPDISNLAWRNVSNGGMALPFDALGHSPNGKGPDSTIPETNQCCTLANIVSPTQNALRDLNIRSYGAGVSAAPNSV